MKKSLMIGCCSFFLILGGCGGNEEVSDLPETDTNIGNDMPAEELADVGEPVDDEKQYGFTSFDLDVDYEGDDSFEVDYEKERGKTEAEVENDVDQSSAQGDVALEALHPYLERLTFDASTADADVISEVLDVFELDPNYRDFELEVTFTDGTKKEYRD